jgi:hypothetical protein
LVNPDTTHVNTKVALQVSSPGIAVTVYPVIGLSPSEVGGSHVTVSDDAPGDAITSDGAPGDGPGTTGVVAEAAPVPNAFAAVTENVYRVPFVSRLTVHDVESVEQEAEPGMDDTV